MACPPAPPIASSRAKGVVEVAYNAPKRYRVRHASVLQSMGSGRRSSRFGHHGRWQRWVTDGIVIEALIGSIELPVNGLARGSAEDDRLVPQAKMACGSLVCRPTVVLCRSGQSPIRYAR